MKLVVALMVCLCCEASFAWRIFFRGRAWDNDFAAPDVSMTQLPEEQWFKQKLDHFDPTNLKEWDQVVLVGNECVAAAYDFLKLFIFFKEIFRERQLLRL